MVPTAGSFKANFETIGVENEPVGGKRGGTDSKRWGQVGAFHLVWNKTVCEMERGREGERQRPNHRDRYCNVSECRSPPNLTGDVGLLFHVGQGKCVK